MRKIKAALFMSLDGVVDSPKDWRGPISPEVGKMMGEGLASADAVLLGRLTYLEFVDIWPDQGDSNPMAKFLNDSPKYVVSNTLKEPLEWNNSTLLSGDLTQKIAELRQGDGGDVQLPGSPTLAGRLLLEGLLDELQLFVEPVVVGKGLRMFEDLGEHSKVHLLDVQKVGDRVLLVYGNGS